MKHNFSISIPGKTFLAGEYLALNGGGAFVFASKPRFVFEVGCGGDTKFHPDSPAGKFLAAHTDIFDGLSLNFVDPYKSTAGFGASTAQFLALHAYFQSRDSVNLDGEANLDLYLILKDYLNLFSEEKVKPSGVDLAGQFCGGLTYFEKNSGHVKNFGWPFSDLHLTLISTGTKLPTHEHLKTLQQFETSGFEAANAKILSGLSNVNASEFSDGIRAYGEALEGQGLVAKHSLDILSELRKDKNVIAAKGCGAMGADVIMILTEKAISTKWKTIATHESIAKGIEVQHVCSVLEEQV